MPRPAPTLIPGSRARLPLQADRQTPIGDHQFVRRRTLPRRLRPPRRPTFVQPATPVRAIPVSTVDAAPVAPRPAPGRLVHRRQLRSRVGAQRRTLVDRPRAHLAPQNLLRRPPGPHPPLVLLRHVLTARPHQSDSTSHAGIVRVTSSGIRCPGSRVFHSSACRRQCSRNARRDSSCSRVKSRTRTN